MSAVQSVVKNSKPSGSKQTFQKSSARSEDSSLRLVFAIKNDHLRLEKTDVISARAPVSDSRVSQPISSGIIGYWVEVLNSEADTIYRRFLPEFIPVNYFRNSAQPAVNQSPAKAVTLKSNIELLLPVLADGRELLIYEQSIPSPDTKTKQRYLHLRIPLPNLEGF